MQFKICKNIPEICKYSESNTQSPFEWLSYVKIFRNMQEIYQNMQNVWAYLYKRNMH